MGLKRVSELGRRTVIFESGETLRKNIAPELVNKLATMQGGAIWVNFRLEVGDVVPLKPSNL